MCRLQCPDCDQTRPSNSESSSDGNDSLQDHQVGAAVSGWMLSGQRLRPRPSLAAVSLRDASATGNDPVYVVNHAIREWSSSAHLRPDNVVGSVGQRWLLLRTTGERQKYHWLLLVIALGPDRQRPTTTDSPGRRGDSAARPGRGDARRPRRLWTRMGYGVWSLPYSPACVLSALVLLVLSQFCIHLITASTESFKDHVDRETSNPNRRGPKIVRLYKLYSRCSNKHVQILGRTINAFGGTTSEHGKTFIVS
ncbi:hypothetical protein LSAT2_000400 [Lamellibrachia satsuma]|nr:hypothetical protein LSAT2_000400 [Lamellibrachia satsuma]